VSGRFGWGLLVLAACGGPATLPARSPATVGAAAAPAAVQPSAPEAAGPGSAPGCASVDQPYVGTLCMPAPAPAAPARHPAIVFFGGYGGDGEARRLAREFSGRGYVTAAVSYFGVPGTPRTLVDVPVEIGVAAVAAIAARADVDPERLALFGSSKGGEYALLVASATPAVKAVIANVPSPFAWYGLGPRGAPTGCSWSRGVEALPCVPEDAAAGQEIWRTMRAGLPVGFRAAYEAARRDSAAVDRAFFPLERIAGPVLCLGAGDDQVWNSPAQCDLAIAYLRAHRHAVGGAGAAADRALTFPGAGHLYLMARSGAAGALNAAPMGGGGRMAFGGTPEADARAAKDALDAIAAFFPPPCREGTPSSRR
jgi:dienelactone hydrolase